MQAPLSQRTFKIGVGEKAVPFAMNSQNDGAQSFGPDDRLYASGKDGILVIDTAGKKRTWVKKLRAKSLIARADGSLYLVERNPIGADYIAQRTATGAELNRMWFVSPQGNPKRVGDEPILIGGITLSPDQTLLYVNDTRSHWVYSYQIQPDGSLQHGQKYFHLHVPGDADDSGAGGMTVDSNGRLYVATRMGIQVCDQPGRVNCIIPVPGAGILDDNELQASFASDVKIGGANFDTLFVTVGAKVLQRKIKPKAALSFLPPVKPNAPGL